MTTKSSVSPIVQLIPATTAVELVEVLGGFDSTGVGHDLPDSFRGCGSVDHHLVPKAHRGPAWFEEFVPRTALEAAKSHREVAALEAEALLRFCYECDIAGLSLPGDTTELRRNLRGYADHPRDAHGFFLSPDFPVELAAVAAHSRVPTRLLDWTRNPLVAAFFAALHNLSDSPDERRKRGDDSDYETLAVWRLSRPIHKLLLESEARSTIGSLSVYRSPAAVNARLWQQSGLFTAWLPAYEERDPTKVAELALDLELPRVLDNAWSSLRPLSPLLVKYTLPTSEAVPLLRICDRFGVSTSRLFPDLDGVRIGIRERLRWLHNP